jgi:hypothetical protein
MVPQWCLPLVFRWSQRNWLTPEMQEEDPAAFELLVTWLYGCSYTAPETMIWCRLCHASYRNRNLRDREEFREHPLPWLKLHAIADRLCIPKLAQQARARYQNCLTWRRLLSLPNSLEIDIIYNQLPETSPLRPENIARFVNRYNALGEPMIDAELVQWEKTVSSNAEFHKDVIQSMHRHNHMRKEECSYPIGCAVHRNQKNAEKLEENYQDDSEGSI